VPLFAIHPFAPPGDIQTLRQQVRDLVAQHESGWSTKSRANCWASFDPGFSRVLGKAGLLGMVWPKVYGGHERHPLERYVVLEELLAAGAPVAAHWIADRQTGPLILKLGTEAQKQRWVPPMARGELFACIGLSEPGAGSDLAAVRTSARRDGDGWRLNGQKVWTTGAHLSHLMLALVRTEAGSERQAGLSQFLIDMTLPGITTRPIIDMTGAHDFNEVFFDDVALGPDALIGVEGAGWMQATAELALERSGPERYLSSHALLVALLDHLKGRSDPQLVALAGRLTADLWTLRQMSMSTAAKLAVGEDPMVEAAVVKDLGNTYEQELPQMIDALIDDEARHDPTLMTLLSHLLIASPSFSLRGGTREIVRGIIARGLGVR
jgi:alkylation response protein AidB-like acyl-CoA dehydrogenase